ncbi:MAG: thioredoxin fold domain-containing protein [Moraxellaceae bacterium]|nr:thioredoxin fold domain-containing protein [Moraxellaceae bacterium]MDZ4387858.1 thioredoxin fold domain-containing protein [Moraxellaceae bacterium]
MGLLNRRWLASVMITSALMTGCLQADDSDKKAEKPKATATTKSASGDFAAVRDSLLSFSPDVPIQEIRSSAIPGLVEVELESGIIYVSEDGKHLLRGDISRFDGQRLVSLTDEAMGRKRVELMKTLKRQDMVIFPAKGKAKEVITVFTDTDCGYCRRLHEEVPAMNRMGIEVRYLAYPRNLPRTGPDSSTSKVMRDIWCHPTPDKAMTIVKSGGRVADGKASCKAPIEAQYVLGQKMGVQGTPAIFTSKGVNVGGYVTAAQLAERLQLK